MKIKACFFFGFLRSVLSQGKMTYEKSGVDITAGDDFVSAIKPLIKATIRSGTLGSIGGFGGLFDTKTAGYTDPILVSGTDGVGTKLKVLKKKFLNYIFKEII